MWVFWYESFKEALSYPGLGFQYTFKNVERTVLTSFIDYAKAFVWITTNYGKFFKRWKYQTTLPASWEICMQVKKQQLELDMEQQTGS